MRFVLASGLLLAGCKATAPLPDGVPRGDSAIDFPPPAAPARRPVAWDGQGVFELHTTDFHFELGGTQVLSVANDGSVQDLFVRHDLETVDVFCKNVEVERKTVCAELRKSGEKTVGSSTWMIAKYTLSADEQAELRSRLAGARIADLDPRYEQKDVDDGTTRTVRLTSQAGSIEVSIYTGNGENTPAALRPVFEFLRAVQTAHAADRSRAPVASPAEQKDLLRAARGT